MLNLKQFIADHVINRQISMFAADIEANKETLRREIENKSVCVVGGAGSIGSSFIRAVLPFRPAKLVVVDLNENGLAELTRDLRSTYGMYVPQEYRTYTLNFADPILSVFSGKRKVLIFLRISLPISMCVARKINILYRRLLRIMTLRQSACWTFLLYIRPNIFFVSLQTKLLILSTLWGPASVLWKI